MSLAVEQLFLPRTDPGRCPLRAGGWRRRAEGRSQGAPRAGSTPAPEPAPRWAGSGSTSHCSWQVCPTSGHSLVSRGLVTPRTARALPARCFPPAGTQEPPQPTDPPGSRASLSVHSLQLGLSSQGWPLSHSTATSTPPPDLPSHVLCPWPSSASTSAGRPWGPAWPVLVWSRAQGLWCPPSVEAQPWWAEPLPWPSLPPGTPRLRRWSPGTPPCWDPPACRPRCSQQPTPSRSLALPPTPRAARSAPCVPARRAGLPVVGGTSPAHAKPRPEPPFGAHAPQGPSSGAPRCAQPTRYFLPLP